MMHLRGGSSVIAEQETTSGSSMLAAFTRLLNSSSDRPRTTSQRAQSATVGIRNLAALCREIETAVREGRAVPGPAHIESVDAAYQLAVPLLRHEIEKVTQPVEKLRPPLWLPEELRVTRPLLRHDKH